MWTKKKKKFQQGKKLLVLLSLFLSDVAKLSHTHTHTQAVLHCSLHIIKTELALREQH